MVEGNTGPGEGPEVLESAWLTPGGKVARFAYRPETNDWNTISAILTHDEYGLRGRVLEGRLIDVGAHVGAWAIAALLDNPGARAIAVEALPENVDLIRRNAALNGLGLEGDRRLEVLWSAATSGEDPVTIAYGAVATDWERTHRFVGGENWAGEPGRDTVDVPPVTLEALEADGIALLKIDCEGCEWRFLASRAIARVAEIVGEVHPRDGRGTADLLALLEPTHDVVELPAADGFGTFRATRRIPAARPRLGRGKAR